MSLSKPFRLFDLPLLPLEQVLLLTEPRALFSFVLSSEKARELLRMFHLVKYVDIDVVYYVVEFSICFKSGEPIKWKFTTKLPVNASEESRQLANKIFRDGWKRTARLFKLDGMRMVLWDTNFKHSNILRCSLSKEHFLDYTRRIGNFLQSFCPGQRIRNVVAGNVGWDDEKEFFYMDRITRREINSECGQGKKSYLEWMNKENFSWHAERLQKASQIFELQTTSYFQIRNLPNLKLVDFKNLFNAQFLNLDSEHLYLMNCKVDEFAVNEYLKKWVNGEFTKRKTLEVTGISWRGLYAEVLNGLTQEPVETWEKLGKPGLVRFSDKLFLNPTPRTLPNEYETVLLKNCHGQFATVVQTRTSFYFTPWDHPLPPINIPKGHKFCENSAWPFAMIVPLN